MATNPPQKPAAEQKPAAVSRWSNRFIAAAIIQGAVAVALTVPIVDPSLKPAVAQVIATGSAGTWLLVGYSMYITVAVIGVAVTALFYHHFEIDQGKRYRGLANVLAWLHLFLMNIGAAVACSILMYGGYFGERALMPISEGGLNETAFAVHTNILEPLVNPAGYALIVTGVGVLLGGIGFLITYYGKQ